MIGTAHKVCKNIFSAILTSATIASLSIGIASATTPPPLEQTEPVTFTITRTDDLKNDVRVGDTLRYKLTYTNNTNHNVTVWPTKSNLTAVAVEGNNGNCRWRDLQPGKTVSCTQGFHITENSDIKEKGFTPSTDWKISKDANGNEVISTPKLIGEKVTNINPVPRPRKDGDPIRLATIGQTVEGLTGKPYYRIPAIAEANNGWILTAWDYRPNGAADAPNPNSIVQRISKDGGKTFEKIQIVAKGKENSNKDGLSNKYGFSDPSYVVDQETGNIFLFFVKSYDGGVWDSTASTDKSDRHILDAAVTCSKDNGLTWSEPKVITKDITKYPKNERARFATSGHGIQLKYGKYKGRLIQQYAIVNSSNGSVQRNNEKWQAVSVYSDDHGVTWKAGNPVGLGKEQSHMDENKVVELSDGRIMLNSRPHEGGANNHRIIAFSNDGGETYGKAYKDETLPDPGNNAQITRAFPDAPIGSDAAKILLYSSSSGSGRANGLIRVSYNDGESWTEEKGFKNGAMAYSTIQALSQKAGGGYGLLYEGDNNDIMYTRISADWLSIRPNITLGSTTKINLSTQKISLPVVNPTSTKYENIKVTSINTSDFTASSDSVTIEANKTTYIPLKIEVPKTAKVGDKLTAKIRIASANKNQDRSSTELSFETTITLNVTSETKDSSTQTDPLPNNQSHTDTQTGKDPETTQSEKEINKNNNKQNSSTFNIDKEYSQNYRKDYSNTDDSRTNYHYSSKAKQDNYSIDNENNDKRYSKSGNALANNRGMMQKTGINTTIPYALMLLLIAISTALMKLKNMKY